MASVCGGCLSLMDAGVPMKAHVAGIAMGLIKDGNRFAVLTDILGDEDHLGDMDFKVAGTTNGITALQMDIKIQGITKEIMQVALAQAKEARMHILGKMQEAMGEAKTEVQPVRAAPVHDEDQPGEDPRRDRQGRRGDPRADRRDRLQDRHRRRRHHHHRRRPTPTRPSTPRSASSEITAEVEIGKVYEGPITKILDFGALVNLLPGKDGLLHISQIAHERVEKVTDYLRKARSCKVKVLETDEKGRVKLSHEGAARAARRHAEERARRVRRAVTAATVRAATAVTVAIAATVATVDRGEPAATAATGRGRAPTAPPARLQQLPRPRSTAQSAPERKRRRSDA